MSDVPNTFIQAALKCDDGDKHVIMKIAGVSVDTLIADNPELHGGHVAHENGKKVLQVAVLKAICGMLTSALPWHRKFRVDLEANGFAFNPCDACVTSKIANKKQQTVRFHADDVMSGHIDAKVKDDFEKWLNKVCGEHVEVKSTQGDTHDCLGVALTLDKEKNKTVCQMFDCTNGMFKEFPLKFGESTTVDNPVKADMFSEDLSKRLDPEKKQVFHRTAAKGLFF